MSNIDSLDEGKKKQEKAIKKGKEAELQARKLEVSLNEVRCEKEQLFQVVDGSNTLPFLTVLRNADVHVTRWTLRTIWLLDAVQLLLRDVEK